MKPFLASAQDWRRPFWLTLLIAASIAFTLGFACAVPFAAFAAATALTLSKRDAMILMLGAWLANQVTGFLFLDYPLDANCLERGAAFGVVALGSLFAARVTAARLRQIQRLVCCMLAFLAAFVAYEASLYGFAQILGGKEDFTIAVQARIFAINACALVGLFAVNYLGDSLRLTPNYGLGASPS